MSVSQEITLTDDTIQSYADMTLECCKEELLETGRVMRKLAVFCSTLSVLKNKDSLPFKRVDLESREVKAMDVPVMKENPGSNSLILLDLNPGEEGLLHMYMYFHPQARPLLLACLATAEISGVPKDMASKAILKQIMKMNGAAHEGWFATRFMRYVLQTLEAYAYVHWAEVWTAVSKDRDTVAPRLEDEPTATEALMVNTETRRGQRSIMLPFTRSERGTGKVVSFGEPQVHTDMQGPMCNILKAIPVN
jgi:hypothetical protein